MEYEYTGRQAITFTTDGMILAENVTEADRFDNIHNNLPFENSSNKHILVKTITEDVPNICFNTFTKDLELNEIVEGHKMTKSPSYSYSGGGDSVTVSVVNNNNHLVDWYNGAPEMNIQEDSYNYPGHIGQTIAANAYNSSIIGTQTTAAQGTSFFASYVDAGGAFFPLSYPSSWSVSVTENELDVSKTGYGSTYKYRVNNRSSYAVVLYSINSGASWSTMTTDEITVSNHNIRFKCYAANKLWSAVKSYSYSALPAPRAVVYIGTASSHGSTTGTNTHGWLYITTAANTTVKYGTSSSSLNSSVTTDSSGHAWIGPYSSTTRVYFQRQAKSSELGYRNSTILSMQITKLPTPTLTRSGYGTSVTLGFTPESGATGYYGTSRSNVSTVGSSVTVTNTTYYYFQQKKPGYINSTITGISASYCSCSTAIRAGDSISVINPTNFSGSTRGRYVVVYFSNIQGGTVAYSRASGTYTHSLNSYSMTAAQAVAGSLYYKITANTNGYLNRTSTVNITKASAPTLSQAYEGNFLKVTPSGGSGSGTYYCSSDSNPTMSGSWKSSEPDYYDTADLDELYYVYYFCAPTNKIRSNTVSVLVS